MCDLGGNVHNRQAELAVYDIHTIPVYITRCRATARENLMTEKGYMQGGESRCLRIL